MANMTIGSVVARGNKSRMRSVAFTHTAAATAAGSATTTFPITGRLLKYTTTGGDAAWTFILNDGTVNVFSSASITAAASTAILKMHATVPHVGIAMAGQYLTCTTANVSTTGLTTVPVITIFWEESAECAATL